MESPKRASLFFPSREFAIESQERCHSLSLSATRDDDIVNLQSAIASVKGELTSARVLVNDRILVVETLTNMNLRLSDELACAKIDERREADIRNDAEEEQDMIKQLVVRLVDENERLRRRAEEVAKRRVQRERIEVYVRTIDPQAGKQPFTNPISWSYRKSQEIGFLAFCKSVAFCQT